MTISASEGDYSRGLRPHDLSGCDPRIRVAGELIRKVLEGTSNYLAQTDGPFDPPLDNGETGRFDIRSTFYDRNGNLSSAFEGHVYLRPDGSLEGRGIQPDRPVFSSVQALHDVQFDVLMTNVASASRYPHYRAEFEKATGEASSRRAAQPSHLG